MKDLEKGMATGPQMIYTSDMLICCTSKLKLGVSEVREILALVQNARQQPPIQQILLLGRRNGKERPPPRDTGDLETQAESALIEERRRVFSAPSQI